MNDSSYLVVTTTYFVSYILRQDIVQGIYVFEMILFCSGETSELLVYINIKEAIFKLSTGWTKGGRFVTTEIWHSEVGRLRIANQECTDWDMIVSNSENWQLWLRISCSWTTEFDCAIFLMNVPRKHIATMIFYWLILPCREESKETVISSRLWQTTEYTQFFAST